MGFFDKLFNSEPDKPDLSKIPDDMIQGQIIRPFEIPSELITIKDDILEDRKRFEYEIRNRDPQKAIDPAHWDGLPQEAQEALSQKGFYREGVDYEIIQIEA